MTTRTLIPASPKAVFFRWLSGALLLIGLADFLVGVSGPNPQRAWQAYLVNFLVWSALAQGGLLFSTLMHTVRARWSGPLSGLSETFAAFFPISLLLFLILFPGRDYVFPWLHAGDLHGKEAWLNLPFLFARDTIGLLILYGVGWIYLYYALLLKVEPNNDSGFLRSTFQKLRARRPADPDRIKKRKDLFGILYMGAFALVSSLIAYDLVMSMDPQWISTLFGAYAMVKAVYIGLGGLIIFAAGMHLSLKNNFRLPDSHFHDIGKLFFAFCLIWGDFFYVQLVVIWYGNIPEETAYVIERTLLVPWRGLAWTIFGISFVIPFFILLNKKIKTMPKAMGVICLFVIGGIWLEHVLLIGPPMNPSTGLLPLSIGDVLITLGFLGLMAIPMDIFLKQFPELAKAEKGEPH